MPLSFFAEKSHPPSEIEVAACLGRASALWRKIRQDVEARVPSLTPEWGYTSNSTGWGLRLKDGKRVILYLTPQREQFLASLALGEKAVSTAAGRRMPAEVQRLLEAAPRYAEGRGVRVVVKKTAHVRLVEALVSLKLDRPARR